jgi:hypothetical protein
MHLSKGLIGHPGEKKLPVTNDNIRKLSTIGVLKKLEKMKK